MAVVVAAAGTAFAGEGQAVRLPKGWTSTLYLPSSAAKVQLADPSLAEVRIEGKTLVVTGLSIGSTELKVKTTGGGNHTVRLAIHSENPTSAPEEPAFWQLP